MTVSCDNDLAGLPRIGRICGRARNQMLQQIEPGMTTAELDAIGNALLARARLRGSRTTFPGLPASVSTKRLRTEFQARE